MNTETSASCRAAQSLYRYTVCTAHGRMSAPVVPAKCCNLAQGCVRSAGGLAADGVVELAQAVSVNAIAAVNRANYQDRKSVV